jgi:hypothetical protein
MKQIISTTLSVAFTSAIHLLCCWLPIAVAVFGQSQLGWLFEYKNVLITLQIAFLCWGFYDMYFRGAHQHTAAQKITLWAAAALTIVLNLMPHRILQSETSQLATIQMERYKSTRVADFQLVNVEPTEKINTLVRQIKGVIPSQIQIKNQTLTIRYKIAQTSEPAIAAALTEKGIELEVRQPFLKSEK